MSMPLKWEFPGGKINPGESLQECLRRELLEEIGIRVILHEALPSHTHHYPEWYRHPVSLCLRHRQR